LYRHLLIPSDDEQIVAPQFCSAFRDGIDFPLLGFLVRQIKANYFYWTKIADFVQYAKLFGQKVHLFSKNRHNLRVSVNKKAERPSSLRLHCIRKNL
jgi:hypothetical protein